VKDKVQNSKVKNYYDMEAEDYNNIFYIKDDEYPPLKFRHKYILEMISEESLSENSTILDAGCGPGELVIDLSKRFNNIFGIDISDEMIRIAVKKQNERDLKGKSILFGVGDIEKLDFQCNYFDVVVCSGVVEYLENEDLWIKEVKRVLKTDGLLIVNVTNKYAVRRWTMPFFTAVKSLHGVYFVLNFIKTNLLGKEKLNRFPFRPRVHCPSEFDDFLKSSGFEKISHNYFDFSLLPYPLDTLFDFLLLKIRKNMEKKSHSDAWLTGNGYIVKCRKKA